MKNLTILSLTLMLLTFGVLQSGCLKELTNDPYPDVTASTYTFTGVVKHKETDINGTKLVDWHYGEAVIKAIVTENDVICTAKVDADGTFTLVLPATVPGTYFNSLSAIATQQGGTIVASPGEVKLFGSTQFKVDYTDLGKAKSIYIKLSTLNTDLTVNRSYFFNFYDLDGSFIGNGSEGNVFNWTFTKGWGLVESYITNSSKQIFNSKSITTVPSNAVWSN